MRNWVITPSGHQAELLHLSVSFHGFTNPFQSLNGNVLPRGRENANSRYFGKEKKKTITSITCECVYYFKQHFTLLH